MSTRKILKKLHLYLALIFCLPLIIQGLSGSILVFRGEISDFILQQSYEFSSNNNHSTNEIIIAAKHAIAESTLPDKENFTVVSVRLPYRNLQAASVRFNNKSDKKINREVLIDAASLQVIKIKNPTTDFFSFTKKLHTNLLIDGKQSRAIIGIYGFILLFMALSGLILWWPKSRSVIPTFSFNFKANRGMTKRARVFMIP